MDRLRVVPHFSSEIVEQAKCEHAWKSPHVRKGGTRREEREMRHYRQSPSFWPFTADWFWSVKFVSPSKSIKSIQWDSFPHWAVIALVICKLQRIFIASKRESRYFFFTAVSREELDSVGNTWLLLMPKCCLFQWFFFLWQVDYALEENFLTEQMWFLPHISYWKVVTRILIFCGYCLWSAWFVLWCKSIFFDLFWKLELFIAAK